MLAATLPPQSGRAAAAAPADLSPTARAPRATMSASPAMTMAASVAALNLDEVGQVRRVEGWCLRMSR